MRGEGGGGDGRGERRGRIVGERKEEGRQKARRGGEYKEWDRNAEIKRRRTE